MELSGKTKIDDLLKDYPFLMDFFVNRSPKFKMLQSTVMRKTVGKVAPLSHVAAIGGIELNELLAEIAAEIKAKTGERVTVAREVGEEVGAVSGAEARQEILKDIIKDLHKGVDMEVLKRRFHELIKDIDPSEIARMEQNLMAEGMPETEIKRLCDVHVEVFKEALGKQEAPTAPAGHPLHTFMKENRVAEGIVLEIKGVLEKLCDTPEKEVFRQHRKSLLQLIDRLSDINLHYLRKENQLFPVLELHEITGPSEVMWAIHDDVRQTLKYARGQVAELQVPLVYGTIKYLLQSIIDMIYKEEHILFPMALEMLSEGDWVKVRKGEEEIGYAWVEPEKGWMPVVEVSPAEKAVAAGELSLSTGRLTPEQVDLLLTHLPVDISFVNENDEIVYYSQTRERVFPRSPGVIGRKVQKCHPPKSFHIVQKILDEFRSGKRDVADFWIQMKGRFIHIRYFAVRDAKGFYRGTMEVSQDVTGIRKLEGEQRLLDWD
ncbi:MAG TPA: DUF438 domain-containing protein [Thermodesulfovibrionales bacterium]|nr:DUF438 domain-containing protein [Thermodesulfovibrionales bacterium]